MEKNDATEVRLGRAVPEDEFFGEEYRTAFERIRRPFGRGHRRKVFVFKRLRKSMGTEA